MKVAVTRESYPGERRVALIPASLSMLDKAGIKVSIEAGAGVLAGFPDADYEAKGATVQADRQALLADADIVVQVRGPGSNPDGTADIPQLKSGAAIISFMDPLAAPEAAEALAAQGVTAFSMELVPRITRAQSMDALSSMATVAGYKAVLYAANHLPKFFPMFMTAAGTISPAKVFVLGAGVAGLQAIATARRLGAVVEAYDTRPVVKEQVESLGARFVELPLEVGDAQDAGGYAKAKDESFYKRQQELMTEHITASDVVITTANVPGKKAPVLVTAEQVAGMRPGSVIVDLAAEKGGNCALTKSGETVVEHGVTIVGTLNIPTEIPFHASQMYSRNITTLLKHLVKEGKLELDLEDEITSGAMVCHGGSVTHPMVLKALGKEPAPEPAAQEAPAAESEGGES